jgi:hypothetical protein
VRIVLAIEITSESLRILKRVWEECPFVVDCFAILFGCTIIFRRKEIDVAIAFRGHV